MCVCVCVCVCMCLCVCVRVCTYGIRVCMFALISLDPIRLRDMQLSLSSSTSTYHTRHIVVKLISTNEILTHTRTSIIPLILSLFFFISLQSYCRNLLFSQQPNVDFMKKLFSDLYIARGYDISEVRTYLRTHVYVYLQVM